MVALKEKNKDRVTLQNVFEIAGDKDSEKSEKSEAEESDQSEPESESEQEQEQPKKSDIQHLQANDMLASTAKQHQIPACSKDQGFTRPCVLILAPFKQMAA